MARVFVVLMALASFTIAWSVPPYGFDEVDYLDSLPLTSVDELGKEYSSVESDGVPAVAWKRSAGQRTLKVRFVNPTAHSHSASLAAQGGWFMPNPANPLTWTAVSVVPSTNTLGFTPFGTAEATFALSGLPNQVDTGLLTFPFQLVSQHTGLSGSFTTELFLTLNDPVSTQVPVWIDVLRDSCVWARGSTNPDDVIWESTTGMFWSQLFAYHPTSRYSSYPNGVQGPIIPSMFQVVSFFDDRSIFPVVIVSCTDASNYLKISIDSQGVYSIPLRLTYPSPFAYQPPIPVETHPICPIGKNAIYWTEYEPWDWQYHQVLNAGGICDPTSAQWYALDGTVYTNPPIQWNLNDYWQMYTLVQLYPNSDYLGLVRGTAGHETTNGNPVNLNSKDVFVILNF